MVDGLYQVTTDYLCAGFVIRNGRVAECAPILRRKIDYWLTQAVLVTSNNPVVHQKSPSPSRAA